MLHSRRLRHQWSEVSKVHPVNTDRNHLRKGITRLLNTKPSPDGSIVIPVNAQGDLDNVQNVIGCLCNYKGANSFELILVVNNFPEGASPTDIIRKYKEIGIRVVSIPDVRRSGEAVGFSARIPGISEARSDFVILFDADVLIPDVTALLDWYIKQFRAGAHAAYTHVGYYDLPNAPSVHIRFALHHFSRWVKRTLLGIPTTRGSNYAVYRTTMLKLYNDGKLADEMNVGPTFQAAGHHVSYSGKRQLTVLTSGRMFRKGWRRILPYYWYRLKYNLRTLPVRNNIAQYTKRENDPVRKYSQNRPIKPPTKNQ